MESIIFKRIGLSYICDLHSSNLKYLKIQLFFIYYFFYFLTKKNTKFQLLELDNTLKIHILGII